MIKENASLFLDQAESKRKNDNIEIAMLHIPVSVCLKQPLREKQKRLSHSKTQFILHKVLSSIWERNRHTCVCTLLGKKEQAPLMIHG